ncbi:MAG: DUF2842 domain-containing protein [Hyphomonadaceae bacterium]
METRTRKAFGCFLLLSYLVAYVALAMTVGAALAQHLPNWALLIYFAAAGIVWIFPLKPLFAWMNRRQ